MFALINQHFRYRKALSAIRRAGIWFVDIPRTSSSSIRVELSNQFGQAFGKSDLLESQYNQKYQYIPSHLTARDMRDRLGIGSWDRLYTFSMVRNPWDRMLSIFRYRELVGELEPGRSYEEYLKKFFESPDHDPGSPYRYHGHYYQSIDYLVDQNGRIMVNFVARYEHRDRDLRIIAEQCNCPPLGALHTQKCGDERSYRNFYNDRTREMVSIICQKDIEAFDYEF